MADDLDQDLGRLAPSVDTDRAAAAFRLRRRRSNAMRRGALGAAAACVVVASTVGVLAARHADTPVTAGPDGSGGPAEEVPRVWAHEPTGSTDGMTALIAGVLTYEPELDCFLLGGDVEPRFPIVWPTGTTGTADGPGVVLPSGETARVGDVVEGGGGFLGGDVAEEHSIPDDCLPPGDEVAVFNPNEDVAVGPAPPNRRLEAGAAP